MEARETDKLFRDKLKNAPTAPKADSWEKLGAMLDEQEKAPLFPIWRVAAAVLVLMVSGLLVFFWNKDTKVIEEVAVIENPAETLTNNHTMEPAEEDISEDVNTAEIQPVSTQELKEIKPKTIERSSAPVKQEKIEVVEPVEVLEPEQLEETQLAQIEFMDTEVAEVPKKKKFKSIKITYKRGKVSQARQDEMLAKHQVDTTGGKKIKELWNQTKEINPGDIWADIRDAKDNLFQRNSKKNNVKNLNK